MDTAADLDFRRHVQDLAESWQGRCLRATDGTKMGAIVLSILGHSFDTALPVLLQAVYPGFRSIAAPFICSAAKIDKRGFVVAGMVMRDERIIEDRILFLSLNQMQGAFRSLADRLKLNDEDRRQLFICAKNWVVADRRLDPAMDPADPGARRLVLH